jgi:hypothetical protein
MKPSSSASQSERTEGQQDGEVSLDDVRKYKTGGFCFDFLIALGRYNRIRSDRFWCDLDSGLLANTKQQMLDI